jgi:hypothetical protein
MKHWIWLKFEVYFWESNQNIRVEKLTENEAALKNKDSNSVLIDKEYMNWKWNTLENETSTVKPS